jgi:hypothetical protein
VNTGQTLITIGAIVLLSFVILRINNSFLATNTVLSDTKTGVLAISLATSRMEKANSLSFDQNSDSSTLSLLGQLTRAESLGPETGETADSLFNDFDDYNGFIVTDSLPNGFYTTICEVCYVDPTNPDVPVTYETWHKKITVHVTSPSLIRDWDTMEQDTVTLSSIFSYWFFLNIGSG